MAAENDQHVFASPWNDSDMVLVVEDQEIHVHKCILKWQSPVFKAMLDGHFQEASQDKITLKEKKFQSMLQFLKILYPSSMFEEARAPLDDKSRLSIIALADEYQCVNLIKQCIDEVKITPENALQILPYAVKYQPTALPKMYDVINWSAPATKLEELVPEIESKETSNMMLLTKCRFLESAVVKMQDAIISLIDDFLTQKKSADDAKNSLNATRKLLFDDERTKKKDLQKSSTGSTSYYPTWSRCYNSYAYRQTDISKTTADCRCPHSVGVREISKTKNCLNCKEKYKEKFLVPIPSCENTQIFFSMLRSGNDVATAVRGW